MTHVAIMNTIRAISILGPLCECDCIHAHLDRPQSWRRSTRAWSQGHVLVLPISSLALLKHGPEPLSLPLSTRLDPCPHRVDVFVGQQVDKVVLTAVTVAFVGRTLKETESHVQVVARALVLGRGRWGDGLVQGTPCLRERK